MSDSESEDGVFDGIDDGARLVDTDATSAPGSSNYSLAHTHDTTNSGCHIKARDFIVSMERAISGAWPTRHIQYFQVVVLMLSWEDTDMPGADDEIKRLESVFKHAYGFTVSNWKIPSIDPDLKTMTRVHTLVSEYGKPENLLIVYYGGHARKGTEMGPIWQPKREPINGQEINTAGIHTILGRAQENSPDVLLLYDCCNPLSAHRVNLKPTRAVVECLFAGGFESNVPVAGCDSFTSALIDELVIAKNENISLPIPELHRRLIVRLRGGQKHAVFKNNKLKTNKRGEPLVTKEVRITPQHLFLCESKHVRSISLAPVSARDLEEPHPSDQIVWPKIMLAVRLSSDEHDQSEITEWLLRAPPRVLKLVVLEESFSNLLLVQIDVSIWDLLPPSPGTSFVGFVSGPGDFGAPAKLRLATSSTVQARTAAALPIYSNETTNLSKRSLYTLNRGRSEGLSRFEKDVRTIPGLKPIHIDRLLSALRQLNSLTPPDIRPWDPPANVIDNVHVYHQKQHEYIEKIYVGIQCVLRDTHKHNTKLRLQVKELKYLRLQYQEPEARTYQHIDVCTTGSFSNSPYSILNSFSPIARSNQHYEEASSQSASSQEHDSQEDFYKQARETIENQSSRFMGYRKGEEASKGKWESKAKGKLREMMADDLFVKY